MPSSNKFTPSTYWIAVHHCVTPHHINYKFHHIHHKHPTPPHYLIANMTTYSNNHVHTHTSKNQRVFLLPLYIYRPVRSLWGTSANFTSQPDRYTVQLDTLTTIAALLSLHEQQCKYIRVAHIPPLPARSLSLLYTQIYVHTHTHHQFSSCRYPMPTK